MSRDGGAAAAESARGARSHWAGHVGHPLAAPAVATAAVLGLTPAMVDTVLAGVTLHALGMGALVTALTLAHFRSAPATPLRGAGRGLGGLSATLLLVVGAYLVYYRLTTGGLPVGT